MNTDGLTCFVVSYMDDVLDRYAKHNTIYYSLLITYYLLILMGEKCAPLPITYYLLIFGVMFFLLNHQYLMHPHLHK